MRRKRTAHIFLRQKMFGLHASIVERELYRPVVRLIGLNQKKHLKIEFYVKSELIVLYCPQSVYTCYQIW